MILKEEHLIEPYWENNTMYNESILPVYEKDGCLHPFQLLYQPETILCVKSASYEKVYQEGKEKDYFLNDDGKFVIPATSKIPVMDYDAYYMPEPSKEMAFTIRGPENTTLFFANGSELHDRQTVITYTHHDPYAAAIKTMVETLGKNEGKLPKFKALLANPDVKEVAIGFHGDSITTGANSSGMPSIHVPPYIPMWPILVTDTLSEKYGKTVRNVNKAVGGVTATWGLERVDEFFREEKCELFVIAFGMNDAGGYAPPVVRDTIAKNMEVIRQTHPDCEFLLVATMLPNAEAPDFILTQGQQQKFLLELAGNDPSIAVAPMTALHEMLLQKKRYRDMTGNNVNHPNDFLARAYAMLLLSQF